METQTVARAEPGTIASAEATGRGAVEDAIRIEHLTKRYAGGTLALNDVSLRVRRGEVMGFLGPNGAGKTTAIRTMLDLLRPTSGTVTVLGHDSRAGSVEIRRRTGYLPGELPLQGRATAAEILLHLGYLRGGVERAVIEDLAERLVLDLHKPVGRLSKGNKQKVGLIQAFMHRPDLLILDEPTSGLDPLVQQTFQRMVLEAKANGQTVFLSSHTLPEVERIADRVAILRQGRLIAVESIHEIKARAIRRIEIEFAEPVRPEAFARLNGVRDVEVEGRTLRAVVLGSVDELIKEAARFTVIGIRTHEPDLEEIFLELYGEASPGARLEAPNGHAA